MEQVAKFWDWIDNRGVVRRIVLAIAIWMTWRVSAWAMEYVIGAPGAARSGADLALIIAAVTGPVTVFGGYVFKAYIDSRGAAS